MEKFPRGKEGQPNEKQLVGVKRSLNQELLFGQNKRLKSIIVEKATTIKKRKSDAVSEISNNFDGIGRKVTAKDFTPNVITIGVVLSVNAKSAKVSLPNGYIGTLVFDDLLDEPIENPSNCINPYQIIECCILENSINSSNKRHLVLSMNGTRVYRGLALKHLSVGMQVSGIVVSEEDHGFIVQTGITGVHCFLPRRVVGQTRPSVGSFASYIIHEISEDTRVIQLYPFNTLKEKSPKAFPLSIQSIYPGVLLSVAVEKKTEFGLVVNYMDNFKGFIERSHLDRFYRNDEWKQFKPENGIVKARVIMVDKAEKWVKLTMRPHLLDLCPLERLPPLGSEYESLQVFLRKESQELYLVDSNPKEQSLYHFMVPPSEYEGETPEEGDVLRKVRVLGYHLVEGVIVCSNRTEKLNNAVLHFSQIQVGEKYSGKIAEIKDFGLIVRINDSVNVLCPLLHVSDTVPSSGKLQKRFKIGQVVPVRIWEVNENGIIGTLKKSFIECTDMELLKAYDEIVLGKTFVGMVTITSENGMWIRFLNKVKAFVPKTIIEAQGINEGVSAFREGQILRVVALDYNRNASSPSCKFIVCINLEIDENKLQLYRRLLNPIRANGNTKIGAHEFVSGFITSISKDYFTITTDDGRSGMLEKVHLFDFSDLFESIDISVLGYSIGSRVSNALVLDELKEKLVLTLKPLLIKTALEEKASTDLIPNDISDLHPGSMVVGYVRKVESYGVLVQFKNGIAALAPRPSLSDRFIATPCGIFSLGNSIRCMVQRVDLQKQRIFVTFKPSLIPSIRPNIHSYLLEYLREEYKLANFDRNAEILDFKSHTIGSIVEASVSSIEDYGVIFRVENKYPFFLVKDSFDATWPPQIGERRELLVIDIDFQSSIFIAAVIVDKRQLKGLKRGEKNPGSEFSGKIIRVTKRYVVVLADSVLGYLPIADFHFPNPDSEQYQVGSTISSLTIQFKDFSTDFDFPHQHINILAISNVSNNTSSKLSHDEVAGADNVLNFFKIGRKIECKIKTVNKTELVVEPLDCKVAEEFVAIVHVTATINSNDGAHIDKLEQSLRDYQIKCGTSANEISQLHPFYSFRPEMKVDCVVVHIQKAEKYIIQFKPALNKQLKNEVLSYYGDHQIQVNSSYEAIVTEVGATSCTIMFSPYVKTELPYCDVSADLTLINSFKNNCFIGLKTTVFVYSVDSNRRNPKKVSIGVSRTLLEAPFENKYSHQQVGNRYQQGDKVIGVFDFRLNRLPNPPSFSVILPAGGLGRVCLTELADQEFWMDWSLSWGRRDEDRENLVVGGFKHGDIVECIILQTQASFYDISLRKSRLTTSSTLVDALPNQGDIVKGFVTFVSEKGCFVRISNSITGRVLLRDLGDSFVADPAQEFPIGKLVIARVLEVDSENKSVQLSLKQSAVSVSSVTSMIIQEGDLVLGIVRRVTDFGVFVKLNDSLFVGLARKNFAVEAKGDRLTDLYEVGDVVKAKVLSVNFDGSKIALDLRRSVINKAEVFPREQIHGTEPRAAVEIVEDHQALSSDLPLSWESQFVANSADEATETREGSNKQKKSARNSELDVRSKELNLIEGKVAPQSIDEFERLVASNPNSSFAWIQYMSYYTQTTDFESSKIIGKRALRTINFREEQEKLNVWLALLSLEYKFGTSESLQSTFSEAIKENKAKSVYLGLAQIYEKNGDFKAARTSLGIALKSSQFRKSKKVWIKYLEMILRDGDPEVGKQELSRALQSLSPHKHVETISRYALVEYEFGSASNGRVLFEDLIASYSKRSDLWFVYIDQETKLSNVSHVRHLFNRMIVIAFSGKVMKTIFKKFLAFEVQFGNETTQDQVKVQAKSYVEKTK